MAMKHKWHHSLFFFFFFFSFFPPRPPTGGGRVGAGGLMSGGWTRRAMGGGRVGVRRLARYGLPAGRPPSTGLTNPTRGGGTKLPPSVGVISGLMVSGRYSSCLTRPNTNN